MMPKEKEDQVEEQDEEDTETEEKPTEDSSDASRKSGKQSEQMVPLSRLNAVINERNDAQKRHDDLEKKVKKDQEEELKKQNNFQKLYENAQGDLQRLSNAEDEVTSYKGILKEVLDSTLSELTDEAKTLVPSDLPIDKQLQWISKNRQLLMKPKAFDIGAGERGSGSGKKKKITLSPEQTQIARSFGLTDEEYAKFN